MDRSFTITGAGTVVTGTLAAGTLAQGDRLQLLGHDGSRSVVVRGLQSRDTSYSSLGPVNRVALNLRDVSAADIRRGDALLTPDAWPSTGVLGIQRTTGVAYTDVPEQLMVHAGTAAVPARLRPFGADHARLVLDRRLPLVLGDRLVLRDPGSRSVLGGAQILDADPPALRRRGDGAHWAERLAGMDAAGDVLGEVAAPRGGAGADTCAGSGCCRRRDAAPAGASGFWATGGCTLPSFEAWQQRLRTAVQALHERDPLAAGPFPGRGRDLLSLPDERLLAQSSAAHGLEAGGRPRPAAGQPGDLGAVEPAVAELERRLTADAFQAPEADELAALGLGVRELAAAERAGRLLRLRDGVVLLPTAPALAMRELARPGAALHHEPGTPGSRHDAAGRGPVAGTSRLARLDPAAGRRSPHRGAVSRTCWRHRSAPAAPCNRYGLAGCSLAE